MKTLICATVLFFVAAGSSRAQADKKPKHVGGRVAVVNIGLVFQHYPKAREFKDDLHALKKQWLAAREKQWRHEKDGNDPLKNPAEESSQDVSQPKVIGLWKDTQEAIKTVAAANDIDIVLGYSDTTPKLERGLFGDVNRNLQAMDIGGTVPLAIGGNADITDAVIDLLKKRPFDKGTKLGTDRVAIVNIGQVFNQYNRPQYMRTDLEKSLGPYKREAKQLTDNIKTWEQEISFGNIENDAKKRNQANIAKAKQRLEEMGVEIARKFGKLQEENLVELFRSVQAGIKAHANRHDIDLVLGYGDVLEKDLLTQFPNVNRKMQAMDSGAAVPFALRPQGDISGAVVTILNDPKAVPRVKRDQFTARVTAVEIGHVFANYVRAQQFKKEIDDIVAPWKEEASKVKVEIKAWETALNNRDFAAASKEEYEKKIAAGKKRLAEIPNEISRAAGKKHEDNLVTLFRDVQTGTQAVADDCGIEFVFAHGEPQEKDAVDAFPNINRKLKAMDEGNLVALYVARRSQLCAPVTETLNALATRP
jgi:Skp family chaperone for outer membrane proteins